ncbi:hypothetical protein DENSPDRAFT_592809 [Dentipellis sp. KUC8613]|nr:hypothetical protein DENSPDRAFT_592809 [Dentipellis sp. KUC8613]
MMTVIHIPRSTDPPIFRLPVEILRMIFNLLAIREVSIEDEIRETVTKSSLFESPLRSPCPWQSTRAAPSWTAILFVCRHWHTVAKNYPALWTQLTHNPVWTGDCVRRSRQMPLTLSIDQTKSSSSQNTLHALHLALPHFHRITDVELLASDHDSFALMVEHFKGVPAPRLETLSLKCGYCERIFNIDENFWIQHPEALFAQNAPRLRTLSLDDYHLHIAPSAPLFRTLTHLEVYGAKLWKHDISLAQFVAGVASWTSLETLVLDDSLPNDRALAVRSPPYPLPTPRMVALPRLRQIRIRRETAPVVDQFLRCLRLPPDVSLFFSCELYDTVDPEPGQWGPRDIDPTTIVRSLLENVPRAPLAQIKNVHLQLRETLEFTDLRDDPVGIWDAQLCLELCESDDCRQERTSLPDWFLPVLDQLSLTNVTEAQISVDRVLSRETWLRVLGPMRALETLYIEGCNPASTDELQLMLYSVLDALTSDSDSGSEVDASVGGECKDGLSSESRTVFLPRLRHLELRADSLNPAVWQRLVAALRCRLIAGSPLKTLEVTKFPGREGMHRPNKQTLEKLMELIEDVVWRV